MSGANDPAATPNPHIDLGDTLADCTGALVERLERLARAGTVDSQAIRLPIPADLEPICRSMLVESGFWRSLATRPSGFELLELLRNEGFSTWVLTKGSRDSPQVWSDKVAWCRRHVPDVPVIVTDDKARVHGHVLVDDWLPYVGSWQSQWPAGLAIVPAQPWNEDVEESERRIRADEHNMERVLRAVRVCRESLRSSGAMTPF
jgi:5'(3')-deoxyribonucleotidase